MQVKMPKILQFVSRMNAFSAKLINRNHSKRVSLLLSISSPITPSSIDQQLYTSGSRLYRHFTKRRTDYPNLETLPMPTPSFRSQRALEGTKSWTRRSSESYLSRLREIYHPWSPSFEVSLLRKCSRHAPPSSTQCSSACTSIPSSRYLRRSHPKPTVNQLALDTMVKSLSLVKSSKRRSPTTDNSSLDPVLLGVKC